MQRRAAPADRRLHPPADRRADGEDVVGQEPQHRQRPAHPPGPEGHGDLGHRPPGQPGLVAGPAISSAMSAPDWAAPDDQHRPGQQLVRVAIAGGVQLPDAGVELVGDVRAPSAVCSAPQATTTFSASRSPSEVVIRQRAVGLLVRRRGRCTPDRTARPIGPDVALQVVAHLRAASGSCHFGRRERQPRQPVVLRRAVEQQRVVALPPLVADPARARRGRRRGRRPCPRKYAVASPVWPAPTITVPSRSGRRAAGSTGECWVVVMPER